jgi:hypothetical protein
VHPNPVHTQPQRPPPLPQTMTLQLLGSTSEGQPSTYYEAMFGVYSRHCLGIHWVELLGHGHDGCRDHTCMHPCSDNHHRHPPPPPRDLRQASDAQLPCRALIKALHGKCKPHIQHTPVAARKDDCDGCSRHKCHCMQPHIPSMYVGSICTATTCHGMAAVADHAVVLHRLRTKPSVQVGAALPMPASYAALPRHTRA